MSVRKTIPLLATTAALLAAAAPAHADVLVSAPPRAIDCGRSIEVGVWYQSHSGGPRRARIAIRTRAGRLLWRKRVRATTRWRYWRYEPPRCGRRYRVVYRVPGGTSRHMVRVRAA
jgi:hypothetical protein